MGSCHHPGIVLLPRGIFYPLPYFFLWNLAATVLFLPGVLQLPRDRPIPAWSFATITLFCMGFWSCILILRIFAAALGLQNAEAELIGFGP